MKTLVQGFLFEIFRILHFPTSTNLLSLVSLIVNILFEECYNIKNHFPNNPEVHISDSIIHALLTTNMPWGKLDSMFMKFLKLKISTLAHFFSLLGIAVGKG